MFKKFFKRSGVSQIQPRDTFPVIVANKKFIADKVVELELRDAEDGDLPVFTAGSHIDLHISPDLIRQYSIANNPQERDRYICAVLLEEEGTGGSKAVFEQLQQGDTLFISQPRNHFALNEDAEFNLLIAGGIGVTPLLSMAYRLKSLKKPFKFYYRAKQRNWAAYADLLVEEFGDSVESLFSDQGGREKFDLTEIFTDLPTSTHLYICGGNDFMQAVTEVASTALRQEQIHLEYFHPPETEENSQDRAFELYCEKSDLTFQVPADKSIVAVLEENGVDIPISCVEGVCGSCITHFIEGEVDHRDFVLSKSEQQEKKLFTPCCSRATSARLTIDI